MASSAQRGAARAPLPPDQLASFYKLVDKQVTAGVVCRDVRAVELAAEAALVAEVIFGDNSLVVADLQLSESIAVTSLSMKASGAEQVAFARRSWAVLVSLIPLLLRRLEANTLLPGTFREEEVATMKKAKSEPVPPPAVPRAWASALGYNTLLCAAFRSLDLLPFPYWPQNERKLVASFVLQALDVIPRTAGVPANLITSEALLVSFIEQHINRSSMVPRSVTPCSASGGLTR